MGGLSLRVLIHPELCKPCLVVLDGKMPIPRPGGGSNVGGVREMGGLQEFFNFVIFVGGIGALIYVVLGMRKPEWSQNKRIAWGFAGGLIVFVLLAFVIVTVSPSRT